MSMPEQHIYVHCTIHIHINFPPDLWNSLLFLFPIWRMSSAVLFSLSFTLQSHRFYTADQLEVLHTAAQCTEHPRHGRMNYKDTEPRLFFKIDLLIDFIDSRYIHSWLVFSTQLVNCCPHGWRNYTCVLLPLYLLSDLLYSLAETPLPPPPPHFGSHTRALLVSQDRRHLFVTPWTWQTIIGIHSV